METRKRIVNSWCLVFRSTLFIFGTGLFSLFCVGTSYIKELSNRRKHLILMRPSARLGSARLGSTRLDSSSESYVFVFWSLALIMMQGTTWTKANSVTGNDRRRKQQKNKRSGDLIWSSPISIVCINKHTPTHTPTLRDRETDNSRQSERDSTPSWLLSLVGADERLGTKQEQTGWKTGTKGKETGEVAWDGRTLR